MCKKKKKEDISYVLLLLQCNWTIVTFEGWAQILAGL